MSRRTVVLCLVVLAVAAMLGSAQAQVGARAMGMGGAFVGLADDASATFYNPAALVFQTAPSFTYTRTVNNRTDNFIQDFLAFTTPFDEQTAIGLSYVRALLTSESMYDPFAGTTDSIEWNENWYWLSIGYKLSEQTALGANVRWISDKVDFFEDGFPLDAHADTQLGVDLSAFHRLDANTTVGLLVQNINEPEQTLTIDGEDVFEGDFKRTFSPGVAMHLPQGFTAAVQIQDISDAVERAIRLGVEKGYVHNGINYALRAGWFGDEDALTLGGGVTFEGWSADLALVDLGDDATWYASVTGVF